MTLSDDNSREALSPELKRFYDWAIGDISNSGAGLCDMPSDAEIHQTLCAALGFSAEDLSLIRGVAKEARARADKWTRAAYPESGAALDINPAAFIRKAERLESLASRIAALLPPSP